MEKDITTFEPVKVDTSNILEKTLINLLEGVTGVASSNRQDLFLSLGHIFQRLRSGRFLKTLKDEWDSYRSKGSIKDDYMETEQHQECLQEMLDFLDKDSPDEKRFSFLKKIFLTAATESITDRSSLLPQQYMRLCRALSSGEALVLQATYAFAKKNSWNPNDMNVQGWLVTISTHAGLSFPELVEIHERELIEKNLLTPRLYSDKSGVKLGKHYRLSDLGFAICEFIEKYEDIAEPRQREMTGSS